MKTVQWTVAVVCFGIGGYLLALSYNAYGKWSEAMIIGDPSGAEFYALWFWPEVGLGLALIVFGSFLVGMLSVRLRSPKG